MLWIFALLLLAQLPQLRGQLGATAPALPDAPSAHPSPAPSHPTPVPSLDSPPSGFTAPPEAVKPSPHSGSMRYSFSSRFLSGSMHYSGSMFYSGSGRFSGSAFYSGSALYSGSLKYSSSMRRSGSYSYSYQGSMRHSGSFSHSGSWGWSKSYNSWGGSARYSGSSGQYSGGGGGGGGSHSPAPKPGPNVEPAPTMLPRPPSPHSTPTAKPPTKAPKTAAPTLVPTSSSLALVPIQFVVGQTFLGVTESASGFSIVLFDTVSAITGVPVNGISSLRVSQQQQHGRALSGVVYYTITVVPQSVGAMTPSNAYSKVSSALYKSVHSGSPNGFTAKMKSYAAVMSDTGISASSSAVTDGITVQPYSLLIPTSEPTVQPGGGGDNNSQNSAGAASNSQQASQTVGIIVGVVLAALVVIVAAWWLRRNAELNKDYIPEGQATRDVSMTQIEPRFANKTHDFDSESTAAPTPTTFSPIVASGHARQGSIFDIIPAQQNPLGATVEAPPRRL